MRVYFNGSFLRDKVLLDQSNKRRCWQQNNNDIAHTTTNPTAGGKTTLVDLDVYDIMNSASTSRHLHHTGALPGFRPRGTTVTRLEPIPRMPNHSFISWTFGRGAVIWRIWPAVLLHTIFAVVVVSLSMKDVLRLDIPNVMLTVLGVVIGFVISYRASSGYDRYWMGRTSSSDVIRNSRAFGRLIWFHVPPRFSGKTAEELQGGRLKRSTQELENAMAEKRMALDLIEGFAVALKHHLRGELGIHYADLYRLIRSFHGQNHFITIDKAAESPRTSALPSRHEAQSVSARPPSPQPPHASATAVDNDNTLLLSPDPVIPPISAYGTFNTADSSSTSGAFSHNVKRSISSSSMASTTSSNEVLFPSIRPLDNSFMGKVRSELIPFSDVFNVAWHSLSGQRPLEILPPGIMPGQTVEQGPNVRRHVQELMHPGHSKHRPKVAGGGQNVPLEILRCLSEWLSVLEDRGTVPGTTLGSMIATIASFEENLTTLENILTTPLPFVYSVHISTVWIYLFFLPFQLINEFGYYTIPGVAIAAFIYLGFLAAGEEIEQPFGYDDNDLDLDLFCHAIIRSDIERLKSSPCHNAYIP